MVQTLDAEQHEREQDRPRRTHRRVEPGRVAEVVGRGARGGDHGEERDQHRDVDDEEDHGVDEEASNALARRRQRGAGRQAGAVLVRRCGGLEPTGRLRRTEVALPDVAAA